MKKNKDAINVEKLQKYSHELGSECGDLAVKLFYNSITPAEALSEQKGHCKRIFASHGIFFAEQVYQTVYTIMTCLNIGRQKENLPPINFYTDGLDEYFQGIGIKPYGEETSEGGKKTI